MNIRLLNQLIKEKDLKQKELAKLSGISATGLNQIIKGVVKPRLETIEKIAAALGVSTSMLMTPQAPINFQSGNINNIMGNHNGINEANKPATLYYGTGEVELLKQEVAHLREVLKGKEEIIDTLKMVLEQYKPKG